MTATRDPKAAWPEHRRSRLVLRGLGVGLVGFGIAGLLGLMGPKSTEELIVHGAAMVAGLAAFFGESSLRRRAAALRAKDIDQWHPQRTPASPLQASGGPRPSWRAKFALRSAVTPGLAKEPFAGRRLLSTRPGRRRRATRASARGRRRGPSGRTRLGGVRGRRTAPSAPGGSPPWRRRRATARPTPFLDKNEVHARAHGEPNAVRAP